MRCSPRSWRLPPKPSGPRQWADYLIRQYVNRIAWGSGDGGYTEGQKYGHKVQFILEALAALKSANGPGPLSRTPVAEYRRVLDVLHVPQLLVEPLGGLLFPDRPQLRQRCRFLRFRFPGRDDRGPRGQVVERYTGLQPGPSPAPVSLRRRRPFQTAGGYRAGRLFPDVGQLAAYDRFYDHASSRIFFRSSPWGDHSHAHQDQNGFVIHAGGEILCCDAGYYTYSGDTYHSRWSRTTQAHNSVLVDGEGQCRGIAHKGKITAFFNTPDACFFTGDASDAYGERLETFRRHVLFIRPDVFVICDDLKAPEPREYTWTLNTFERADISERSQSMTIRQRDQRLLVRHLTDGPLKYAQNNHRPFPLKTRDWCRFTEAFPQQWNIRATTEKRASAQILAVMNTFGKTAGSGVNDIRRVEAEGAEAVHFQSGNGSECVLFRTRRAARLKARAFRPTPAWPISAAAGIDFIDGCCTGAPGSAWMARFS